MTDEAPETPAPHLRYNLAGHKSAETAIRQNLSRGRLKNGWMITGAPSIGKATLAYRLARAFLAPEALVDDSSLEVDPTNQTVQQIGHKGHPDLYVLERQWNEKTDKLAQDITVENVRKLGGFFGLTASTGRRVVIVDSADDMNRNAANAFLKSLEEPPANSLLLLLVNAPGRILPTIRSRCRVADLMPVSDKDVAGFVTAETGLPENDLKDIVEMCDGRPGYALQLASEDGIEGIRLSREFIGLSARSANILPLAEKLTAKAAEPLWRSFTTMVPQILSNGARSKASADNSEISGELAQVSVPSLVSAWEKTTNLLATGDALNLDKTQILIQMSGEIRNAFAQRF